MAENTMSFGESTRTVPGYVLPSGTVLNVRYRLEELLGKGGFGITYRARDLTLDVQVAVKEYFPDQIVTRNAEQSGAVIVTAGEKKDLERECEGFLEEARRLGQFVDEPGIVGVRDFFRENGTAYIVMEYLSGETLRSFMDRQGKLSMPDALALLEPVMRSLDRVHKAGIIHRDISPENIFLTRQGAKLLDFGTARPAVSEGSGRHTVLVKPGYAPAEQYDEAGSQGPWCDVYSLSAVLYECVTGTAPQDSLRRLFKDSVLPPSRLGISISAGQEQALLKGLALKREDRYQTVSELAGALGLPAFAPAAPQPGRAGRTVPASSEDRELLRQLKARQQPEPEQPEPPEVNVREQPARPEPPEAEAPEQPGSDGSGAGRRKGKREKRPAPAVSAAGRRKERRKAEKGKFSFKKLLLTAGGILAALVIALVAYGSVKTVTINGTSYSRNDTSAIVQFTDTVVKTREVRKIAKIQNPPYKLSVYFTDCTFEKGSLEALSKLENVEHLCFRGNVPDIQIDFPMITSLDLFGMQELDSLELLYHFPALTSFGLSLDYFNQSKIITDYSPVSSLTELKHLNLTNTLSRCGVTDLSFISGLKNLVGIRAYADTDTPESARLTDIGALAGCPSLKYLELQDNLISDLSPLANCPDLEQLTMDNNRVSDLSPLAGCTYLTTLHLDNNLVSDLSPLAGCLNLQYLEMNGNRLTSLAGLENAKKLYQLDLNDNQLNDISALAGTANISWFHAENNSISDLTPLSEDGSMTYLYIGHNALTSLDGCEKMVKLKALNASYNQISDIEGLRNCSVLETAGLGYNQIEDLAPLGNNGADLKYLEVSHNRLRTLAGLENCTGLQALSGAFNEISDLSPLQNATEMTALLLAGNQIGSLSPLSGLTKMAFLDVRNNRLSSINGMENMTRLLYIDLSSNQIESIAGFPVIEQVYKVSEIDQLKSQVNPFKALSGLTLDLSNFVISLEHNQIKDISPLPEGLEYSQLSVYDNPLEDYGWFATLDIDASIFGKGVYIPYREGNDTAPLTELRAITGINGKVFIVDAPLDKQGQWEKDIKGDSWNPVNFLTAEEADETLAGSKPDSAAKAVSPDEETGEVSPAPEGGEEPVTEEGQDE